MKAKKIILTLLISASASLAWCQTIIIKHTGFSDASIFPLVLSTDSFNHNLAEKYLRLYDKNPYNKRQINWLQVSLSDQLEVERIVDSLHSVISDTTTFKYGKGSFDFYKISTTNEFCSFSINNWDISIKFIQALYLAIERKGKVSLEKFNSHVKLILLELNSKN